MTRARQVANFDPALFAADEVSGDKVIVTSDTASSCDVIMSFLEIT